MRMIIAPTDFSAISLNAVNYAADLSLKINTDLLVVHVSPLPMLFSEVPTPAYNRITELKEAEEQLLVLKEKLVTRVKNRVRIVTEIREGDFLAEIDACCEHIHPFAVVIGSESMGPFERFLFGGKALTSVHSLTWPLIIVPPEVKFDNIYRIGLACDFRHVAKTLPVREIRDFVKAFDGNLHIIHVNPEADFTVQPALKEETEWLQELLGDLSPQFHFIHDSDITGGVRDFAEKIKLDILIVVPKKHDLLERIFHRSRSKQLVLHTHVPVMAVHE